MTEVFKQLFPCDDNGYTCKRCGVQYPPEILRVLVNRKVDEDVLELAPLCPQCIEDTEPHIFPPDVEETYLTRKYLVAKC